MIKSISIKNMRQFKSFAIDEFKRFNLIVGGANSGKTSLLESAFLLLGPTNPLLAVKVNSFRDLHGMAWSTLFRDLDTQRRIRISGELISKQGQESRELELTPSLASKKDPEGANGLEEADSREGSHSRRTSVEGVKYHCTITSKGAEPKSYNLEVSEGVAGEPKWTQPTGYKENIPGVFLCAYNIRGGIVERFGQLVVNKEVDEVLEVIQSLDPRIKGLHLAGDQLWCDVNLPRLVQVQLWGSGLHNVLAIMLALHYTKGGVLLIDEIENGLHYSGMGLLWRAIREAARKFDVQVIATTHSNECVQAFNRTSKEELALQNDFSLFRLERDERQTVPVSINMDALETALESHWEIR